MTEVNKRFVFDAVFSDSNGDGACCLDDPGDSDGAGVSLKDRVVQKALQTSPAQVQAWEYWIGGCGKKPRQDAANDTFTLHRKILSGSSIGAAAQPESWASQVSSWPNAKHFALSLFPSHGLGFSTGSQKRSVAYVVS